MNSLRFATARDLYDTFPTAKVDVGTPASDEDSLAFLQSLVAAGAWQSAVSFCTYLLARREAVWWGCQSLRRMMPDSAVPETAALDAAEAWVHEPEEELRRNALNVGMAGNGGTPGTWMALAAGWSGGSIVPPEFANIPAGPHLTARAVRAGILIALTHVPEQEVPTLVGPCIEEAIQLALGPTN